MTEVFLLKELELPDCNYSHVHRVFGTRELAEQCLREQQDPKLGREPFPERFIISEYIVDYGIEEEEE